MKILIAGATGLIGSAIGQQLSELGHSLVVVSRNKVQALEKLTFAAEIIECDLNKEALAARHFVGVEAIINLAGESIDGRWTPERKQKILNSRSQLSRNLLHHCPESVGVVIAASAQGVYGDRGEEELSEDSSSGAGFLADVCRAWEAPFLEIKNKRVVVLRLGMVLSKKGGALKKLAAIFQRNLGATLGSGRQWMSFISLDDLVKVVTASLTDERYSGILNAVCPQPMRNADFTKSLCRHLQVLRMPAAPAVLLRAGLGEMADLILTSAKVKPVRLLQLGFKFEDENLDMILEKELRGLRNNHAFFFAEQFIPHEMELVFDFFSNHENLEKITPAMLNFQTEKMSTARVEKDTLIDYRLKIRGIPIRWRTLIKSWNRPYEFVDTQIKGPYAYWRHTHKFRPVPGGTLMTDEVRYRVPLGFLGNLVAGTFVEKDVNEIFAFRRRVIAKYDFAAQ